MKLKSFLITIALLTAVISALFFALPQVSNFVLPQFLQGTALQDQKIRLNYISPWRLSASFEIENDQFSLRIPEFEIHYSPRDILNKNIKKVVISGPYFSLKKTSSTTKSHSENGAFSRTIPTEIPFSLEEVVLQNGIINLFETTPKEMILMAEMSLQPTIVKNENTFSIEALQGKLLTRGDLQTQLGFSITKNEKDFVIEGTTHLDAKSLGEVFGLSSGGEIGARFNASLARDLSSVKSYHSLITTTDLSLVKGQNKFTQEGSAEISIQGSENHVDYEINRFILALPLQATLSGAGSTNLSLFNGNLQAQVELPQYQSTIITSLEHKHGGYFTGTLETEQATLSPEITLKGLQSQFTGNFLHHNIQSQITSTIEKLEIPQHDLRVEGITTNQKIFTSKGTTLSGNGDFTLKRVLYGGESIAEIHGTSLINGGEVKIQSSGRALFDRNLSWDCRGNYNLGTATAKADCKTPKTAFNQNSLPRFAKNNLPEGLTFSGFLGIDINLDYSNTLLAQAQITVDNTNLKFDSGLSLNNIQTKLHITDLFNVTTAPSQHLSIEDISYNAVKVNKVAIDYKLEAANSLFIEKSAFKWSKGRVESNSLRLSTEEDSYQLTLYCDRVGLTEVLQQFGIPGAEGTGSLNGRIPISYDKGKFFFDDGFLFSSPGDSGVIRFTETETLSHALGANPAATHLEYSMKAIENFQYNWTTLSFNSVGENLTVSMKLDGKPASPLPYAFKNGIMIQSDQGPGLQHPVNFNVNFHLPLTEILRLGKNFQSIMENM